MDLTKKFHVNRTSRYLAPTLNYYGKSFIKDLLDNTVLNKICLGDKLVEQVDYCLYLLLNIENNVNKYNLFYEKYKNEDFFVDSYPFINIYNNNSKKVIIIKIPEIFMPAYDNFKIGKYSKMYSKEDIDKILYSELFSQKESPEKAAKLLNYEILTKTGTNALNLFTKTLNQEFNVNLLPEEVRDSEWDTPIIESQEFFNYY